MATTPTKMAASPTGSRASEDSVVLVAEFGSRDENSHLLAADSESDDECGCGAGCSAVVVVDAPPPRDRMRLLRRQRRQKKTQAVSVRHRCGGADAFDVDAKKKKNAKEEGGKLNKASEDYGDYDHETEDESDPDEEEEEEEEDDDDDLSQPPAAGQSSSSLSSSASSSSPRAEATKPGKTHQRIHAHWYRRAAVLAATKVLWPFLRKGGANTVLLPNGLRIKRSPVPSLTEAHAILLVGGVTPVPVPSLVCAFVHRGRESFTVLREAPGLPASLVWDDLGAHHREWLRRRVAEMLAYLHAMPVPDTPGMRDVAGGAAAEAEKEGACEDDPRPRLVFAHGNFKLDNVILDPWSGEVVALVDWERAGWYPAGWEVAEREYADGCCPPADDWSDFAAALRRRRHR